MANLCAPIRNWCESNGYSHLALLNACNAHLGKLKGEVKGEDKRSDGKYNAKKDTFKMNVTPGRVQFTGVADIPAQFIAWHDAVSKAHAIASMDVVALPDQFIDWAKFAKVTESAPVVA